MRLFTHVFKMDNRMAILHAELTMSWHLFTAFINVPFAQVFAARAGTKVSPELQMSAKYVTLAVPLRALPSVPCAGQLN